MFVDFSILTVTEVCKHYVCNTQWLNRYSIYLLNIGLFFSGQKFPMQCIYFHIAIIVINNDKDFFFKSLKCLIKATNFFL